MFVRLFILFVLALGVSGCATTSTKLDIEQLQSRVTDLEKKTEGHDSQIVDLQYQVKDLSNKIDTSSSTVTPSLPSTTSAEESTTPSAVMPVSVSSSPILRVKVSPEDVQTALKAAGVYTGEIDGKIGSGTRSAIVEFQKSHGLKADGVLGKKTWEELKTFLKS